MKTTLNKILQHSPCQQGWKKLLKSLGKTRVDDETITIERIIKSNGIQDAVWCLRAVDGRDMEIRLFAVWCARQVQYLMTDPSIAALDVAERYAHGRATEQEVLAACADARAARTAVYAASDAFCTGAYIADSAAYVAADTAYAAICTAGAVYFSFRCAAGAAKALGYAHTSRTAAYAAQENELLMVCKECENGNRA